VRPRDGGEQLCVVQWWYGQLCWRAMRVSCLWQLYPVTVTSISNGSKLLLPRPLTYPVSRRLNRLPKRTLLVMPVLYLDISAPHCLQIAVLSKYWVPNLIPVSRFLSILESSQGLVGLPVLTWINNTFLA